MTIYTAGYQTWRLEDLDAVAAQLGATIVDIRFSPKSSREEWRKESLAAHFGKRYCHMKDLGNKNYQGGEIVLSNPLATVAPIHKLLQQGPVILLCMCRDWRCCHRRDAAEFLAAALEQEIKHLEPPSRKRPATPAQQAQNVPSDPEASFHPPTAHRLRLKNDQRKEVAEAWRSGTLSLSVVFAHLRRDGACKDSDYAALVQLGRELNEDWTDYSEEGR